MITSIKLQETVTESEPQVSLEEYLEHPPQHTEWVDGEVIEKTGMTLKHSQVQVTLASSWKNYKLSSGQGGQVYTEALCRTNKQGRRPDVSYLTPDLSTQYVNAKFLPQGLPLIAEIVSPDDSGEELFLKAKEYLESGCQEVWLVYPESSWVIILTAENHLLLTVGETASTQIVLPGFSIPVEELLA